MANNVNLSAARILRACIMHTAENAPKFSQIGSLQALRSPQLAGLQTAMSAEGAGEEKRLSFEAGAGADDVVPKVRLNYRKQYTTGTTSSTRSVNTSGTRPGAVTELDVTYTGYKQYDLEFRTIDLMSLEEAAKQYYDGVIAGAVQLDAGDAAKMTEAALEFYLTVEKDLLQPLNTAALTALIAAVGTNKVTNSAVPKDIYLYYTDSKLRDDFWGYLNDLRTVHGVTGKWIVIGGLKMVSWLRKSKIMDMNSLGMDAKAMYDTLPAEFYYDPQIDTSYGQDKILIIEPGSACWQQIMEHETIVKKKKVANTSFGGARLKIAQYDSPTFDLKVDLRVREYDTTKYPYEIVTPSSGLYGVFTRPAGFAKAYDGWSTYTGIIGARLVNTEPVV
ncbi:MULTISPECIES: hypothetical protein [unclassified Spirosoma]|uniref:hypothetical protein n=1 Tax=unclassified Spirosoma TaxID=2621999 RepID=UPI00095F4054|nr:MULTISPECIES: hypothetical protein [unclassified Spirosoma]MBN8824442.1 hypothetical protein [Spirosoma sp.]OJW70095.1 MAG: hypothetical protein BGO59_25815 [Spirosoma sp. 48-14]